MSTGYAAALLVHFESSPIFYHSFTSSVILEQSIVMIITLMGTSLRCATIEVKEEPNDKRHSPPVTSVFTFPLFEVVTAEDVLEENATPNPREATETYTSEGTPSSGSEKRIILRHK